MGHIEVKDLRPGLPAQLRRRAEQAGQSIRGYVFGLIRKDLALPAREDWLATVGKLTPVDLGGPASDLIRAARSERGGRR